MNAKDSRDPIILTLMAEEKLPRADLPSGHQYLYLLVVNCIGHTMLIPVMQTS